MFKTRKSKLYWTEILILLALGFPIWGGTMIISIYTAISVVDLHKNLTDLQMICSLMIFVFIPFIFAFTISSLFTDQIMKRVFHKIGDSK